MASIYGGASGSGWKLRLDYTVTQDRAANTSSLRLRLYLYANTTGSYNLEKDAAYYVLQGQKVYQTYQYTVPGWYLLGERTVTVRHGADGNGSVQLGGQWVSDVESSWTPASLSVSAAVALPRILRPSVLRAAELTLGQACVLSIRAEEERYTHRVTYALGGASGTVVQETAQRELTWTPPLELARQLPRSVAGTMRLTVTTYDGDTTMGSSVTECRVYVPDTVRPTAALTVMPVNDNAGLEQWGVFVKGMTRLRWQVTAQGAYGSSIDGCSVSCGGVGGSGLSGVSAGAVSVSGEVTAAAVVKDSRGRSVSVEAGPVTVYEYSGPTMTRPAVCRCDADGTACSDGGYVKVKCGTQCSDVGGRNQVSLRVRSRRPGGEFGGYTALESGVEKVLPGFSPLLSYELELSAEDLPGSRRTVVCAIPTAAAAVHLASGGTAVGVGKYAEHDRAVEVNPEWEVYVKGKPLWGACICRRWTPILGCCSAGHGSASGTGSCWRQALRMVQGPPAVRRPTRWRRASCPPMLTIRPIRRGITALSPTARRRSPWVIWAFRAAAVGTIPMPRRPSTSAAIPKRAAWVAERPTTICRRIWRCTSGNGRHEKEEERWHPIILPSTTAPTERR